VQARIDAADRAYRCRERAASRQVSQDTIKGAASYLLLSAYSLTDVAWYVGSLWSLIMVEKEDAESKAFGLERGHFLRLCQL
jgi:hypothetical protein